MSCGWFRYNTSAVFASNSPTLSMSSTAIRRDYSNSCMILVNEGINPSGISIYKHLWLFPRNWTKGNLLPTVYSLPIPFKKYHLKFNVNNKNRRFPTTSVRWKNSASPGVVPNLFEAAPWRPEVQDCWESWKLQLCLFFWNSTYSCKWGCQHLWCIYFQIR